MEIAEIITWLQMIEPKAATALTKERLGFVSRISTLESEIEGLKQHAADLLRRAADAEALSEHQLQDQLALRQHARALAEVTQSCVRWMEASIDASEKTVMLDWLSAFSETWVPHLREVLSQPQIQKLLSDEVDPQTPGT